MTEENSACKFPAHESGPSVFMIVRFYSVYSCSPLSM